MTEWQPIETAPKDGRHLVKLDCDRYEVDIARFRDGKPFIVGSEFHFDRGKVTHWMPLPSPPT